MLEHDANGCLDVNVGERPTSDDAAETFLLEAGVEADDMYQPLELITVTAAEKLLGDKVEAKKKKNPVRDEKLIEALEWATLEDGEDVGGGRRGVEWSIAKDVFAERKGGSGDRSNVLKAFKAAVGWLESIARVEVVGIGTEKFIVLRAPVEMAA